MWLGVEDVLARRHDLSHRSQKSTHGPGRLAPKRFRVLAHSQAPARRVYYRVFRPPSRALRLPQSPLLFCCASWVIADWIMG